MSKLYTGLVSVSFRNKDVEEVVRLAKDAGLSCIEWGGDVHVPPKDREAAKKAAALSEKAGLFVSTYGSYFRLGKSHPGEFTDIAENARLLNAPTVRIWAYDKKRSECPDAEYRRVVEEGKKVFEIAARYGLRVHFEYHRQSLTETLHDAQRLFEDIAAANLSQHWQPNPELSFGENLTALSALGNIDVTHVFAWTYDKGNVRHPLSSQKSEWTSYLAAMRKNSPETQVAALEFFTDDSEKQFFEDAACLREMAESL